MSEQHTPGRLKLLPSSETTIYTDDEHEMFVASCGTGEKQRNRETKANARRLAACWNLLADVPTKEIEAAANYGSSWGKTGLELAAVTAQRDELLEALKCLLSLDDDHQRGAGDQDVCVEVQRARAVIAKVEWGGV